jgi:tyrosyl-tRNA synthetase
MDTKGHQETKKEGEMTSSFIEEVRWRGMVKDITPHTLQHFKDAPAGYIGFDPTATSLHIGNLAAIMLLKQLQLHGHKPIILLGGFTGMIGDPAGKSAERKFLSEETLQHNLHALRSQFEKFLDFDDHPAAAETVNNDDWLKNFSLKTFLRDVGKLASVNQMMAKESVKKRIESENGISFTEFSYQLLQAYDFYWLHEHKACRLQMGGSDQWGNITSGLDLIRRMTGKEAFAITCPLITKADGGKFGKTEEGNIWLDPVLTSPYKFYQYWLNVDDSLISQLLRTFTLLSRDEIVELEREAINNPNLVKRALADDMTKRVHSSSECLRVSRASELLFGKASFSDFEQTDENTLKYLFEDLPQVHISRLELESKDVATVVSLTFNISKGEARRLLLQRGITINEKSATLKDSLRHDYMLLKNQYLLVRKGKQYGIVQVIN